VATDFSTSSKGEFGVSESGSIGEPRKDRATSVKVDSIKKNRIQHPIWEKEKFPVTGADPSAQ
jgi:hypothetical protein